MTNSIVQPGRNICEALNNAHTEWTELDKGKKHIYFEDYCDDLYGCTFVYDYTNRRFYSWRITDENKYTLFLMKHL